MVKQIERYDFSNFLGDTDVKEDALILLMQLFVCKLNGKLVDEVRNVTDIDADDVSLMVSGSAKTDELWHEFMLHPKQYQSFCSDVALDAGGFPHCTALAKQDSKWRMKRYERFLKLRSELFEDGPATPETTVVPRKLQPLC